MYFFCAKVYLYRCRKFIPFEGEKYMDAFGYIFLIAFIGFIIYKSKESSLQSPTNGNSSKKDPNPITPKEEQKQITIKPEFNPVSIIETKVSSFEKKKPTRRVQNIEFEIINDHKVSFIDETHEYIVDGVKVFSVSEILKMHASFFNISDDYANIPEDVLRRAAEKGTKLHSEIENYEKFGKLSSSIEFKNYLKLKKELKFSVKESEKIILLSNSSGKVVGAGRMDMLINLDGDDVILDIKRTYRFYRSKVTAQTNLYKLGYNQTYGSSVSKLMCMRLREFDAEIYHIKDDLKKAKDVLELL